MTLTAPPNSSTNEIPCGNSSSSQVGIHSQVIPSIPTGAAAELDSRQCQCLPKITLHFLWNGADATWADWLRPTIPQSPWGDWWCLLWQGHIPLPEVRKSSGHQIIAVLQNQPRKREELVLVCLQYNAVCLYRFKYLNIHVLFGHHEGTTQYVVNEPI